MQKFELKKICWRIHEHESDFRKFSQNSACAIHKFKIHSVVRKNNEFTNYH